MLKSLLHKSSDIFKAINEAWQQSENPEIFTVKIIDPGKKGFLGFSHKPAIISFTYEQTQNQQVPLNQLKTIISQGDLSPEPLEIKEIKKVEKKQPLEKPQVLTQKASVKEKTPKNESCQQECESTKQKIQKNAQPTKNQNVKAAPEKAQKQEFKEKKRHKSEASSQNPEISLWDQNLAQSATNWVDAFFKNFGMTGTAKIQKFEDHILTILLEKQPNSDSLVYKLLADNLFICACATLAVQSLRNQSSQRLKGLKIKILIDKTDSA